jgi:hypothetical protein
LFAAARGASDLRRFFVIAALTGPILDLVLKALWRHVKFDGVLITAMLWHVVFTRIGGTHFIK